MPVETLIKSATPETIAEAAQFIKNGELVALPTETVYGLGANALDGVAIAKIFAAKNRPEFNPLIVHFESAKEAFKTVQVNDDAKALATEFWPGPLTMILRRSSDCPISALCSAGLDTLAVRVPAHRTAQALIRASGVPIAAPSANKSGTLSPTTAQHVHKTLGGIIPFILADGACAAGLESTVIDLSDGVPVILRPGIITAEQISECLQKNVPHIEDQNGADPLHPKSPGLLLKHYAPSIPVRLNAVDIKKGEALLGFGSIKFMGLEGGGKASDLPDGSLLNLSESGDLYEAAANLFSMLHTLDQKTHKAIAVMNIPNQGLGVAINDRLKRAAAG